MTRTRLSRNALATGLLIAALLPLTASAADDHVGVAPDGLKWSAGPAALPKGAQIAVLFGDPSKEGGFAYRLKLPPGFKVAAHTHPADENVTVISGSLHFGMGPKLDEQKGDALKAGGFVQFSKGMQHYAWFTEETVIQINGNGPWGITYVNAADDPRKSQ